jgi:hypothetical protein
MFFVARWQVLERALIRLAEIREAARRYLVQTLRRSAGLLRPFAPRREPPFATRMVCDVLIVRT